MCDTLEKQKISLISNILQGNQRDQQIFKCHGKVDDRGQQWVFDFENEDIADELKVGEKEAILTYKKPYANTLHFQVSQSTHANYSSMYGVMALVIDTKHIERRPGRIVLKYDLLQMHFKIGEYTVELIYGEDNNVWK